MLGYYYSDGEIVDKGTQVKEVAFKGLMALPLAFRHFYRRLPSRSPQYCIPVLGNVHCICIIAVPNCCRNAVSDLVGSIPREVRLAVVLAILYCNKGCTVSSASVMVTYKSVSCVTLKSRVNSEIKHSNSG